MSEKISASVLDEGVAKAGLVLDFVGAGVVVTSASGKQTISISGGGGGGGTATTVEVDVGSTPTWRGKFTITDAAITTAKKVLCWQAPGPYTGKGTLADEAEMDFIDCQVEPLAGTATVRWQTKPMIAYHLVMESRRVPPATGSITYRDTRIFATRLGKVRGNIKFTYQILT